MEQLIETKMEIPLKGEVTIGGKVFRYKITPRTRPYNWTDLEIIDEKSQTIKIFFNPKRQSLMKEITRELRLYKWIK
jgi:hypothetical protein